MIHKAKAKYIGISITATIVIACLSLELFRVCGSSQKSKLNHLVSNQSVDIKAELSKSSNFRNNLKLQLIVDDIVRYVKSNDLSINALSISLIDTKTGDIGRYNSTVPRYPASIVKLFWLVSAYQKFTKQEIQKSSISTAISEMILKSDNLSANQVLEAITKTKSTLQPLPKEKLRKWYDNRQQINTYYHQAGYSKNLDISQKTFPIVQQNNAMPIGADRQVRTDNLGNKVRNKLTTDDAARLMYELVTGRLMNSQSTEKIKKLLQRDLHSSHYLKQNAGIFNPIEGFLGEGLSDIETNNIISKAGRTSSSRQEVAFISSKDGKNRYILAVFGDDPAYGKSKKIFPEISNLVYKQMRLSK
jgi:beta-lactamase class A